MQREVIEGAMLKKLPVQIAVPVENFNLEPLRAAPHAPEEALLEGFHGM